MKTLSIATEKPFNSAKQKAKYEKEQRLIQRLKKANWALQDAEAALLDFVKKDGRMGNYGDSFYLLIPDGTTCEDYTNIGNLLS